MQSSGWTPCGGWAATTLLPFLIGLERFIHRKPIDFRPFVIILVGACGLAIGAMEMLASITDPQSEIDPGRVFEGVITGIGFLGPGAALSAKRGETGVGELKGASKEMQDSMTEA